MIRPDKQPDKQCDKHFDRQSDGELVRRIAGGDEDSFRSVYRRCHGAIYRFALQMTGNASIAEDVTQETFMFLIRETRRFDPARGSLAAYLFGVGRNLLSRRLERERAFVPLPEGESSNGNGKPKGHPPPLVLPPPDPARKEAIDRVRRMVLSLPANYREVVVLCDLQELSYQEAAAILDCAVGTVRSRLHRARAMLTERLREFRNYRLKSAIAVPRKS